MKLIYSLKVENSFNTNISLILFVGPPRFLDCLGPTDKVFRVYEGGSINATCIYSGSPAPSLRCVLLDANGKQLRTTTPEVVTSSYTSYNPMIISNVPRTAKTIRCTIFHAKTGTKKQTRKVLLLGKFHGMLPCFNCIVLPRI